jgi:SAM-dependent methyltransferase
MPTNPLSASRLAQRDRFLDQAARDLLEHDRRLSGLRVEVRFDGGVAHVRGEVADEARLALVRDMLGRLDGVFAVWDWVRVAGRAPVVLDLGCGDVKQAREHIGVDLRLTKAVDVVADVAHGLPFQTDAADRVFAVHVLEHLPDYLPLLDEIHRVLRPGGVLHVLAPWWRHVNAVADPTHIRFLDVQTIKSICRTRPWHPLHAGCDGSTVFADLTPLPLGDPREKDWDESHSSRFFD